MQATTQQSISMTYDFDTPIERRGTDCVSVEQMAKQTGRDDLIPLWVADMDFATPPFVTRAIEQRLQQRILGYTCAPHSYYECIAAWNRKHFAFNFSTEHIHYIPGIVPGIYFAVNCLSEKGDSIMIETPVYHPFASVTRASGRKLVEVPLKLEGGRYQMDYEAIERNLPGCRLLIFCNPHNPGGTSWSKDEIARLVKLCNRYGVTIISDEIHADMTFKTGAHVPTAISCPEAADITVTLMAPTKAFNLPGVVASHTTVTNDSLRRKFFAYLDNNDIGLGNIFAYDCVEACYSAEGEEWLQQMLDYVKGNIRYVDEFLKARCPRIKAILPEASFLVFLDNRGLGLTPEELDKFYIGKARLFLNNGEIFGQPGQGFMRLNVGQPRCILQKAMEQLAEAYESAKF